MKKLLFVTLLSGFFITGCKLDSNILGQAANVINSVGGDKVQVNTSTDTKTKPKSKSKVQTVTDLLDGGTLGANVGDVFFTTKDDAALIIFDKCKYGDICKVTGVIEESDGTKFFKSVTKAEYVGSGNR